MRNNPFKQPPTLANDDRMAVKQVEAARLLGVSVRTLYKWDREGIITGKTIGGVKLYSIEKLKAFAPDGCVLTETQKEILCQLWQRYEQAGSTVDVIGIPAKVEGSNRGTAWEAIEAMESLGLIIKQGTAGPVRTSPTDPTPNRLTHVTFTEYGKQIARKLSLV